MDRQPPYRAEIVSTPRYKNILITLDNETATQLYQTKLLPDIQQTVVKKLEDISHNSFSAHRIKFVRDTRFQSTALLDLLMPDRRRLAIIQGGLNLLKKGGKNPICYHSYYVTTEDDRLQLMKLFEAYVEEVLNY